MKDHLRLLGAIALIWALLDIVLVIKGEPYYILFWFSNSIFLLLSIGLLFRNQMIVSSIAIAAVATETWWGLDFFARLITTRGLFPAPTTEYMFTNLGFGSIRFYVELSHLVVIALALYGAYKLGMHKKAYILCCVYAVVFNLSSYFFTPPEYNVNCAHYFCLFRENPSWLQQPYYVIIWICFAALVAFLLNLLFNRLFVAKNK